MKFGKLPSIVDVDFSLPPDNDRTLDILGRKPSDQFEVFVGISRWASKEWIGHLYPAGTKPADYLRFYSQAFNTIELNSTHYRSPTPEQVRKWKQLAAPGFRFCPKLPQTISHGRKLMGIEEELSRFLDSIAYFEEKLGCCFLQLHESFAPTLMSNLEDFLQHWPRSMPLAVELRHPDWFEDRGIIPELLELLESSGTSTVITDVAGRRDVSHGSLSNKTAMIRFVGNDLHESDFLRSDAWIKRISLWQKNGLETLYLFPHEPGDRMASDLGDYWISQLNRTFDLTLAGSSDLSLGGQMTLF